MDLSKYKEFDTLGKYFGCLRHELMTHSWIHLCKNNLPRFDKENTIRYKYGDYQLRNNILDLAIITRLDNAIHSVVNGKSLILLEQQIYFLFEEFPFLKEKEYLQIWTPYISKLIATFLKAPQTIVDNHIRSDLHYVYNEEYARLSEHLGMDDLKSFGLVPFLQNETFPMPVQKINKKPIWTLGQIENFLLKGKIQSPEWPYPIKNILSLELIEEQDNPEENVYQFNNDAFCYFNADHSRVILMESSEKQYKIYSFLSELLQTIPEIHFSMGMQFIKEQKYVEAKKHLTEAVEQYENALPDDFIGKIATPLYDGYHFSLAFLGYLALLDGNLEICKNYFEKAQSVCYEEHNDFSEEIELLENNPDKFIEIFKHTHFVDDETRIQYFEQLEKLEA